MPPQRNPGLSILAGASVFAACCMALVLSGQAQPEELFVSPTTASRTTPSLVTQYPIARSVQQSTVQDFDYSVAADEENSDIVLVTSKPSTVQSLGLTAICTSFILAAAGFALKAFTSSQKYPRAPEVNLLEAVPEQTFVMASVAAKEKRAAKLAKKKTKASKPKKEEKAQKTEEILPPKEVFRRMRLGVLRRVKKPTKSTGRVCQLLGKVDNRQARSISFSHRRTKRLQKVNLHWRRLWWEEGRCFVRLRLSTKGIKTITRYGLHQAAIKFGLDLTKNTSGTSERKYIKYLPEKEKKFALVRDAQLRYKNAVRWAKLNDEELPQPPKQISATIPEQAVIAMAVSHGKKVPRLGRPADQRKALLRNLTTELIRHGRIKTTLVKAQAMRKHVDHMITLAKQGTLHDRRQALGYVYDKDLVKTLFDQVPERYAGRNGGYTRIIKTLPRKGDAAKMCFIELV